MTQILNRFTFHGSSLPILAANTVLNSKDIYSPAFPPIFLAILLKKLSCHIVKLQCTYLRLITFSIIFHPLFTSNIFSSKYLLSISIYIKMIMNYLTNGPIFLFFN